MNNDNDSCAFLSGDSEYDRESTISRSNKRKSKRIENLSESVNHSG